MFILFTYFLFLHFLKAQTLLNSALALDNPHHKPSYFAGLGCPEAFPEKPLFQVRQEGTSPGA